MIFEKSPLHLVPEFPISNGFSNVVTSISDYSFFIKVVTWFVWNATTENESMCRIVMFGRASDPSKRGLRHLQGSESLDICKDVYQA